MSKIKRERGIESLNKERYKHKYAPRDIERKDLKKFFVFFFFLFLILNFFSLIFKFFFYFFIN